MSVGMLRCYPNMAHSGRCCGKHAGLPTLYILYFSDFYLFWRACYSK